jgi:hypothetical protein
LLQKRLLLKLVRHDLNPLLKLLKLLLLDVIQLLKLVQLLRHCLQRLQNRLLNEGTAV